MILNLKELSVPKIAEVERCAKNSFIKREFPICVRLKISKAEIFIFRFTICGRKALRYQGR